MKQLLFNKIAGVILKLISFHRKWAVDKSINDGRLIVGDYTYGKENLHIMSFRGSEANVKIGKFCSIASDVRLITGGIHPVDWVSTYPIYERFIQPSSFQEGMPSTNGDIIIGNDVWIATDVTILSGIRIGNGAIIGTGSVITRDVPDYAIVAGNPGKLVRFRFKEEDIKRLLLISWWDWKPEKIVEFASLISSDQIDTFINKALES
jgi:acetyltransferase-like isoleucine patch superfamily enzyme